MAEKPKKKGYDFKEVEERLLKFWEDEKIYKFEPENYDSIFSIDTPPPTVSGAMHIGHAYSYTQQDFIARFRRMKQGVFYPFGTDDNGLPTERLVERLKEVKSKEMTRAEFIELCQETLKETKEDFVQDWKNLGISCDYDISYSTIDDKSRKLSQQKFIELYKKGEIYEKEFPTIWCTECQTAIAQAELEDKEMPSYFSTLRFKIKEDGNELLIATTRPELLPACVAVFVHPEDERYKDLVGKTAVTPLFKEEVPIIADESAEPEKGTGVLMICSYGDKFDVEAINKYNLEPKIVFEKDGTVNYGNYEGLKIKDARKKILEDLENADLITEKKEISHSVNTHDKCGTEIEFLPTKQWFIKLLDKKEKLIEQGKKVKWYPEHMFKRYENWVKGLEWDWNISRNRHFGIPIPLWKCPKCGKVILPEDSELPVDPIMTEKFCEECNEKAIPETMVLDTWATSSISPQIASSLVDGKIKLPYSLRPQGHDIIRTWAFYTIARSFLHENEIPWKEIMVAGNVTLKGEKMSKSKGNGINPKEVLEKYGADPLRLSAALPMIGSDPDYREEDLTTGKKLINKLTNASKFVFMNLEGYNHEKPEKLEKIDSFFLEKVNDTIEKVTKHFEKYEYSKSRALTEQLFWKDFCDNYLEIVKKRVYQGEGQEKLSAQYTLYTVLLKILEIFAPIIPFVTEEIYQTYFKKTENEISIHKRKWPETHETKDFSKFDELCEVLYKVRQEKSNQQKSMKSEIKLTLEKEKFEGMLEDLANVTNAIEIKDGEFNVEFV